MLRFYENFFFSGALGSFTSAQRYGREKNMCYILTCVENHKTRIYIHLLSFEALNFWRPCASARLAHALARPWMAGPLHCAMIMCRHRCGALHGACH
jgi:hypothetical protein